MCDSQLPRLVCYRVFFYFILEIIHVHITSRPIGKMTLNKLDTNPNTPCSCDLSQIFVHTYIYFSQTHIHIHATLVALVSPPQHICPSYYHHTFYGIYTHSYTCLKSHHGVMSFCFIFISTRSAFGLSGIIYM